MRIEPARKQFTTPEQCLQAVREDPWALKHVPERLKTAELCSFAVQQDGRLFRYVPESLKTAELCLAAVRRYGEALEFVPESLKTAELCLTAVRRYGEALEFVPKSHKTLELCLAAIEHSIAAHEFVPEGCVPPELLRKHVPFKVIGVGTAGINAVNHMIASGLRGMLFVAADTDAESLTMARTNHTILLGGDSHKGLAVGDNPDAGRQAAEESFNEIRAAIGDAVLVFIVAGMGGGTGTGAMPVIAKVAKDAGAFTVGVVTKPFSCEGKKRLKTAEAGIQGFRDAVDSLIVIPCDRLVQLAPKKATFVDMLKTADEVLHRAVRGISDLLVYHSLIGIDSADVQSALQGKGFGAMGFGAASGESRARDAAMRAITSPLLEDVSIAQAGGVLINITSNKDLTIEELGEAACIIQEEAHEDARIFFGTKFDDSIGGDTRIFFGSMFDDSMGDELRVTIIVAGCLENPPDKAVCSAANRNAFFK
ncbi:MAG: Cell division protein FtsZ [Desulfovibrio sp.]